MAADRPSRTGPESEPPRARQGRACHGDDWEALAGRRERHGHGDCPGRRRLGPVTEHRRRKAFPATAAALGRQGWQWALA